MSISSFQSGCPDGNGKPSVPCDCKGFGSTAPLFESACNICDPVRWTGDAPCVGVIGAYRHNTVQNMVHLRSWDTTNLCHSNDPQSPSELGLLNASGYCIPNSTSDAEHIMQKEALVMNETTFNGFKKANADQFDLVALNKAWGTGPVDLPYNRGVHASNCYVGESAESISFTLNGTQYGEKYNDKKKPLMQKVLYTEAHGDLYDPTTVGEPIVPGVRQLTSLERSAMCNTDPSGWGKKERRACPQCYDASDNSFHAATPTQKGGKFTGKFECDRGRTLLPQCPGWVDITKEDPAPLGGDNYNKRTGGCVATRKQYGPGVYNILAYVPKTEDQANHGRGYVYAIWPFSYAEVYEKNKQGSSSKASSQFRTDVPCYNSCDANMSKATKSVLCPTSSRCQQALASTTNPHPEKPDLFSIINHEIDIEIPCNSPEFSWEHLTWSTMNVNTWVNDIDNYDELTGAYYSQVAVCRDPPCLPYQKGSRSAAKTFIADAAEDDGDKDYHWYTIDWFVNNDKPDGTDNYVAVYFDDPFDPDGNAKIFGKSLPTKPRGDPVHKTTRFVPTRAGRLNMGPWMGWWGFGGKWAKQKTYNKPGYSPQFDTAKVRTAFLSITPCKINGKVNGYTFPQTYDQPGVQCDFVDLYSKKVKVVPPSVQPAPPPAASRDEHGCELKSAQQWNKDTKKCDLDCIQGGQPSWTSHYWYWANPIKLPDATASVKTSYGKDYSVWLDMCVVDDKPMPKGSRAQDCCVQNANNPSTRKCGKLPGGAIDPDCYECTINAAGYQVRCNKSARPPATPGDDPGSRDVPPASSSSRDVPPASSSSRDVPPASSSSRDVPPASSSRGVSPTAGSGKDSKKSPPLPWWVWLVIGIVGTVIVAAVIAKLVGVSRLRNAVKKI